ncbi:hypothetical protein CVT24_009097 [Panaeolus cyanescens]|uniref:Aminoglycoside phosphotransferase domain-containing protein n=1 Tax=Panaeolus cyanescens TaxID=181874 RepID=A0A409VAP4_9AGAR|nr:hypothetical protein CVT24_009097 [Panaeolus cyanescens]
MEHQQSSVSAQQSWRPTSRNEIDNIPDTVVLFESQWAGGKVVFDPSRNVVWKYTHDLTEELQAAKFAKDVVGIPGPQIFHHAPIPSPRPDLSYWDRPKVWYICMEKCPGVPLISVLESMTDDELDIVARQMREILQKMATVKSSTLGNVNGGPLCNPFFGWQHSPPRAFQSCSEFIDYFRRLLTPVIGSRDIEAILQHMPIDDDIHFVHGDLLPQNIMVEGTRITAVIDWCTAGFYPAYWEYCTMHNPHSITPGWDKLLRRVFPEPHRKAEIVSVNNLIIQVLNQL